MKQVIEAHEAAYNTKPDIVVSAPSHMHLIGEHSWFFKDKTLSMAVNVPVYIALSFRSDGALHFYFAQQKDRKHTTLSSLKFRKEDRWSNALKAIAYGFTSGGFALRGMDMTVYSDMPPSLGFGITTAMKVGAAYAIRAAMPFSCSDAQLLQVIERGNKLFLKTQNFLAANYTALYAKRRHVMVTDYATGAHEAVPFDFPSKKILLTDARVQRVTVWNEEELHQPEYVLLMGDLKERKRNVWGGWVYEDNPDEINEMLGGVSEIMRHRLQCIMREHKYVLDAVGALGKCEFGGFARAVNASHKNMRDDYDLSCPEVDWMLKRLSMINPNLNDMRNPYSCGRITGKGFGRCAYTILNEDDIPLFKEKLSEYERIFGFHPHCYEIEPADGAHVVC